MERFVNETMARLSNRIPAEYLTIIQSTLFYVGKDYEISHIKTELAPVTGELPQEAKEYLVSKKIEGLTDETLKQYRYSLERFCDKVRKPVAVINSQDIRLYLYGISKESKMSDKSLENQRTYIRSFFKWLALNGYINSDPSANITTIKCEKKERQPLSDTEMESLRGACKTLREKAIVETLYSTGCRVSELINIKIDDIDFEKREIRVFGKGKKHRVVFLNAKALLTIRLMLGSRKYEYEYLFENDRAPHGKLGKRSIEKLIKKLGSDAQISGKVFPHRIRHTTATDALRRGMSIEQVQLLLGHENVSTTLEYAKVNRDELKDKHAKYII